MHNIYVFKELYILDSGEEPSYFAEPYFSEGDALDRLKEKKEELLKEGYRIIQDIDNEITLFDEEENYAKIEIEDTFHYPSQIKSVIFPMRKETVVALYATPTDPKEMKTLIEDYVTNHPDCLLSDILDAFGLAEIESINVDVDL